MRYVTRTGLAVLLPMLALAGLLSLRVDDAEAHALLVQSDPPVNAELQGAPQLVFGIFSEALDERLSSLEVVDGTGERVDDDTLVFGPEAERMSIGIEGTLEPGFYSVIWETLSAVDGHLFKGSYPFTVLNADGTQPSGPRFDAGIGGGYGATAPKVAVKWALILAATALVGGLAFTLGVSNPSINDVGPQWRERTRAAVRRRLMWLAWPAIAVLALGAGGELLLQADQLGGLSRVGDSLRNDWGERWIQRQIIVAGLLVAMFACGALWRSGKRGLGDAAAGVALAGGAVYLFLVATVSHGSAVPGSFWAVGGDSLHLLASSVWVGMLTMLALFMAWLRREAPDDARADLQAGHLQRFSVLAATSVVVLMATGVANGLAQIPNLDSMIDTAYGRSLTIKLAIMAALLAVAGLNAFLLRPRALDEADEGGVSETTRRYLSLAVWAEMGLAVAVLLAAAVLIQYPTARQLDQVEAFESQQGAQAVVGFEEIQPAGDVLVNLTVSPATVGQNSFRVFLFPQEGGDVGEVLRVRLRFQKQGDSAISDLILEAAGPNAYRGVGPYLNQAGAWSIYVDVRRAEVDDVTGSFPVEVASSLGGTGGQFDYPLTAASWLTVAGVVVLVVSLLLAVWVSGWPDFPEVAPRLLRVGSAAFTVIGVGVVGISLLPSKDTATGNPIEANSQSIAVGRELYSASCQQCHGVDGRGDGPLAPELPVAPADFRVHIPYHQDEFFFRVMTSGIGSIMPSFGEQLTEDERWHLLNFLKSEFGVDDQQSTSVP